MKHEDFVAEVARAAISRLPEREAKDLSKRFRLAYGVGPSGTRGVTYYNAWVNGLKVPVAFVELCAGCESSAVQLAGTTVHELAHVLAGHGAGHGKGWKDACARLGLVDVLAAGTDYSEDNFEPDLWTAIAALGEPTDGAPLFLGADGAAPRPRPCKGGHGARGGKSRGKGSGSRSLRHECDECGMVFYTTAKWVEAAEFLRCPAADCEGGVRGPEEK